MKLLDILKLSNRAVHTLLCGHDREAEILLIQALSELKSLVSLCQDASSEFDTTDGCSKLDTPPCVVVHRSESTHLTGLHDSGCFVYCNPLTFFAEAMLENNNGDARKQDTIPSTASDMWIYTSVVLLNMALLLHQRGISEQDQDAMTKAEQMYELVTSWLDRNESNFGTPLWVKIAAINNLSQIHRMYGDYEFSCEGFQYLADLLPYVGQHLYQTKSDGDVFRGLLLNSMVLVAPRPPAPAA